MDGFKVADAAGGASSAIKDGTFLKDRGCTDIICLIIFISTLIGMVIATTLGFTQGNLLKLLAPIDQHSLICGHNTTNAANFTNT